jgi:DNA-binding Lrp family transcriptional regulator
MRYLKGEFITVPNKNALLGIKGATQSVYLWLCAHANEAGQCFPSKATIAKEAGVSPRSVFDAVNELVQRGILKKTARGSNDGSKRQQSNLYQIIIVSKKLPVRVVHGEDATGARGVMQTLREEGAPRAQELNTLNINPIELNNSLENVLVGELMVDKPPALGIAKTDNPKNPAPAEIDSIIQLFLMVNEAYQKFFNLKVERRAAENLLKRHSIAEVASMMEFIRAHKDDDFFPTVQRPVQLEEKWSSLETRRNKGKGGSKAAVFARTQEELNNPKSGTVVNLQQ